MLFLAEDLGGGARPVTDDELAQYLAAHADKYARPAQVSFIHVFAATDSASLARLRPTLASGVEGDAAVPPSVGEPFPLGRRVIDAPLAAISQNYGPEFRDAVERLPIGVWSEPLPSRYGIHLVKVLARRDGGAPTLADVRTQVRLDRAQETKTRAAQDLLRTLRARTTVTIDDRDDGVALPVSSAKGAD
jgi:hypothetical protein